MLQKSVHISTQLFLLPNILCLSRNAAALRGRYFALILIVNPFLVPVNPIAPSDEL
jgi:hypothetical protein